MADPRPDPAKKPQYAKSASAKRPAFDWQIEVLWEVLASAFEPEDYTNAVLAKALRLKSQAGITQRRNGTTPLGRAEANRIIEHYQINRYGLDADLFEITDEAAFRATLKRHGVGIYANSTRTQLIARLDAARAQTGLTLKLREAASTRAIIYDDDPDEVGPTFYSGQRVRAVITGRTGRHVALLQIRHGSADLIDILSPTGKLAFSELEDFSDMQGRLLVPPHQEQGLKISHDTGDFRLLAIEAEAELIDQFALGDPLRPDAPDLPQGPERGAPPLSDAHARHILNWLDAHPGARFRTAERRFFVDQP